MIKTEEFTNKEQLEIAEFIFAYQSGTLIKPEAEDLIRVFQDHHVPEAFVANLNIDDTVDLLVKNTSHETREDIMHKYYSGKL